MRKKVRGSLTIEAAYVIPLILMVVGVVFFILFYCHDKNILLGTAHETAVYGAGQKDVDESMLEVYFTQKIKGKLLLFTKAESQIRIEERAVHVSCRGIYGKVTLQVACFVKKTDPEGYIRNVRRLIKIGEGMEKQD